MNNYIITKETGTKVWIKPDLTPSQVHEYNTFTNEVMGSFYSDMLEPAVDSTRPVNTIKLISFFAPVYALLIGYLVF